jgi:polyisoprenoid-binding protein YceI
MMTKKSQTVRALAAALAVAAVLHAEPKTWQIDTAHSSAQFSVRHMMVTNVRGQFSNVTGSIVFDPDNLAASKISASIETASIDTGNAKRDDHLRSADFFDVARFPAITFESKQFARNGGKLQVRGDLTMHGVTREVVLDLEEPAPEIKDTRGLMRIGASATTVIHRKDWGVTWNRAIETGGMVVGDEVKITIDVAATRKPEAAGQTAPGGR